MNFIKKLFRKKSQQVEEDVDYSVLTCPKCQSTKVTLQFFSLPDEKDDENTGVKKVCQICQHEWDIEVVEKPPICRLAKND